MVAAVIIYVALTPMLLRSAVIAGLLGVAEWVSSSFVAVAGTLVGTEVRPLFWLVIRAERCCVVCGVCTSGVIVSSFSSTGSYKTSPPSPAPTPHRCRRQVVKAWAKHEARRERDETAHREAAEAAAAESAQARRYGFAVASVQVVSRLVRSVVRFTQSKPASTAVLCMPDVPYPLRMPRGAIYIFG